MMRMARPAHPGQFIRMEVIEPLGLSVTKAAAILGVTRPALSALLNGHAALTPEMALRIEKAFGPKMDTFGAIRPNLVERGLAIVSAQPSYDVGVARCSAPIVRG